MNLLVINAGSSSLKFQLYEMPEEKVLASGLFEKIGSSDSFYTVKIDEKKHEKELLMNTHKDAVDALIHELIENKVINSLEDIDGIGHRVVHGGSKYTKSALVTDEVIQDLKDLTPLAPLHNPAHVIGIEAFKEELPNVKQVVCFDTAFHQTMDRASYLYGVPYDWYTEYGIRKYGFHGMSHKYVSERISKLGHSKIIVCHLGNGASISAVKDGKCIDTSMGFTPNAGVVMGTRCGDIDATFIPYLMDKANISLDEVMNNLNKKSGLLGLSGVSSDGRDVEAGIDSGNDRCVMAFELFVKRIVEYISKYYVELDGADAICFTAGIGEKNLKMRKRILDRLTCLGIKIDEQANIDKNFGEGLISTEDSSVACYVVPTDEEVMIVRDTLDLIK